MDHKEENESIVCVNCQKAVGLIQTILDDEATVEQKKFFSTHLDKCKGCFDHFEIEKDILDHIKAKLQRKCCPEGLINKIKSLVQKSK